MDGILEFAGKTGLRSGKLAAPAAALVAAFLAATTTLPAAGQVIDLSLNLHYSNQADPLSGGTWDLAVKTDQFGLAALFTTLTGVNEPTIAGILTPYGEVNGEACDPNDPGAWGGCAGLIGSAADFSETGNVQLVATFVPIDAAEQNRFYGVGSIIDPEGDGGSPNYAGQDPDTTSIGPEFTTLTNVQNVPWGTGDFLDDPAWEYAAILFSGTFSPGETPEFATSAEHLPRGRVYLSLPATASEVGDMSDQIDATRIVRSDLGQQTPGDFNGDGVVDLGDYTVWRDNLGAVVMPTGVGADGNANGVIDAGDYTVWKNNLGAVAPGLAAAAAPVPEPQSLVFAAFAAGAACLRYRRGRTVARG